MNLWDIADPHCVETIATVATAVATTLAAIVTAWMAVETKRMASATKRSVDLEFEPILGIRDVRVGVSPTMEIQIDAKRTTFTAISSVHVAVELFNASRVAITYRMKSMRVTFAGRTIDSASYLSRGGVVLPGSSSLFWHAPIALDPPVDQFPATGRIHCKFEYNRHDDTAPKELSAVLEYTVAGPNAGAPIHWMTVDEEAPVA